MYHSVENSGKVRVLPTSTSSLHVAASTPFASEGVCTCAYVDSGNQTFIKNA